MARGVSAYERYGHFVPAEAARLRIHIFNSTETISGLAHRYYGDYRFWRLIATENVIEDVRKIEAGTRLVIPDKPGQKGRYVSL